MVGYLLMGCLNFSAGPAEEALRGGCVVRSEGSTRMPIGVGENKIGSIEGLQKCRNRTGCKAASVGAKAAFAGAQSGHGKDTPCRSGGRDECCGRRESGACAAFAAASGARHLSVGARRQRIRCRRE